MRVIWLLGGDARVKRLLETQLSSEKAGVEYSVRLANTLEEIPEDHLLNSGVMILLDAFHPKYPGFEGLKQVRAMGFEGPVFLFGEPSPDLAVLPFKSQGLTGYFPSLDRADFNFVAGMLHYRLHYEGELDLTRFLLPGGRASIEAIKSFKDFNAFGVKLATFIGRFGVDISQLKKVLMGLCLGHVKTTGGSPSIDQPFNMYYGMDPNKVLLAVSTYSRGATKEAILGDFCDVLGGLRNQKALPGTIFPELYHVSRAAENLVVFSGSAKATTPSMDPVMLLTAIAFPNVNEKKQAPIGVFGFAHVTPTAEIEREKEQANATEKPSSAPAPVEMKIEDAVPAAERPPSGMIPDSDINAILNEPQIIGDSHLVVNNTLGQPEPLTPAPAKAPEAEVTAVPEPEAPVAVTAAAAGPAKEAPKEVIQPKVAVAAPASATSNTGANTGEPLDAHSSERLQAAEREVARLKEVCAAMGQDIRRLMKERRQPTTDRELRDAVTQLEEKLKRVTLEKMKALSEHAEQNKQIETLKTQVDALRRAGGKAA